MSLSIVKPNFVKVKSVDKDSEIIRAAESQGKYRFRRQTNGCGKGGGEEGMRPGQHCGGAAFGGDSEIRLLAN